MKSTRGGASQKEMSGHLVGGYITLLTAMQSAIEKAGGKIYLNTPVKEVVIRDGRATGVRLADGEKQFDAVVVTLQTPVFQRLIPSAPADYLDYLSQTEYIGIICPLLVLDRPLSKFWTLNITDESKPPGAVPVTVTFRRSDSAAPLTLQESLT